MLLYRWGKIPAKFRVACHFEWPESPIGLGSVQFACHDESEVYNVLHSLTEAYDYCHSKSSSEQFPEFGFRWLMTRWLQIVILRDVGTPNMSIVKNFCVPPATGTTKPEAFRFLQTVLADS